MLDTIVSAYLEGGVVVGAIWVLSRALPLLSPAVKATLWWCAAAKFIVTVFWAAPLVVPVLPAPTSEPPAVRIAAVAIEVPPPPPIPPSACAPRAPRRR